MKLKHIIILQNKIDLVKEGQAKEQYEQILKFVQGKIFLYSPMKVKANCKNFGRDWKFDP